MNKLEKINRGIIYYNKGEKCVKRLLVSLYSLRKVYGGDICVLHEGTPCEELVNFCEKMYVSIDQISEFDRSALVTKAFLSDYTPFEQNIFIDADTIVFKDPSILFDYFDNYEFIATRFADWKSDGGTISNRIKKYKDYVDNKIIEDAVHYGPAINTGVFGFIKGAKILEKWQEMTILGYNNNLSQIPDELGCQLVVPQHSEAVVIEKWNESVKFSEVNEDTGILHFHGRKHCGDRKNNNYWKEVYWNIIERDIVPYEFMKKPNGDRSLAKYIEWVENINKKNTFVTAVNDKYLDKFLDNYKIWMQTSGLMEMNFIVFYKDVKLDDLPENPRFKYIEWNFKDERGERASMLSAFIFGVAEYVETKFWTKIDADVSLKVPFFDVSKYFVFDISGHRWGYTKVKGDDNQKLHWLNVLDNWYSDKKGYSKFYNQEFDRNEKVRDQRIASFFCVQRTSLTKYILKLHEEDGMDNLIIPSHDTMSWYIALREMMCIGRINFKKYFSP